METITVELGARSYPVHIGQGLLAETGRYVREALGEAACAVITDDNVGPLYLRTVADSLTAAGLRVCSITLPHGEGTKCLDSLKTLYNFLSESHITRRDVVIALGGGVMGDLAGLAAATWLRGLRFVQLPTSLLAQVDSSVGGKVAVDLPQGKNLVGAFWQPSLVLCDADTLATLTERYWHDGLGEVVKYGAIADPALFTLLEQLAPEGRDGLMAHMEEILHHCIAHKAMVVAKDETDLGLRATLNFGHTLGHAVEACQHYQGLSHGMAVAAGMAAITRLSEKKGTTVPGTAERLSTLLRALGLPDALPDIPLEDLLTAMGQDKKRSAHGIDLVLLDEIGRCRVEQHPFDYFRR